MKLPLHVVFTKGRYLAPKTGCRADYLKALVRGRMFKLLSPTIKKAFQISHLHHIRYFLKYEMERHHSGHVYSLNCDIASCTERFPDRVSYNTQIFTFSQNVTASV